MAKKKLKMRVLIIIVLLFAYFSGTSQVSLSPEEALADTSLQCLITTEQDSLLGKVINYLEPEITFKLQSGDLLYYDISSVKAIIHAPLPTLLPINVRSEYYSSYQDVFFSSSAYSLPKGRKQFTSTQLFINQLNFAATDHYSIAIGYAFPFYLIAKMKIASNKPEINYNMAAGVNFLYSFNSNSEFPRAIHIYIASTLGKPDKYVNFNFGYGVNLNNNFFGNDNRRAFIISGGGAYPVNEKLHILIDHLLVVKRTENLFFPGFGLSYRINHHRLDMGYFYYTPFSTPIISAPGINYKLNF